MGVFARNHAQQLILDLAGDPASGDVTSALSPRAQLLLLHIALQFGGDQEIKRRDVLKGTLWNREAIYREGLGKKARAIGYNVPKSIDRHPGAPAEKQVPDVVYNRIKAAVHKAVNELVDKKLLTLTQRGQTGTTSIYSLAFLSKPCEQCEVDGGMDETLHLSDDQREEEFERIGESRGGAQDAEKTGFVPRSKPKGRPVSPWDRLGVHE